MFAEGELGDFVDPVPFQSAVLNDLDGKAKFWIGKDYVNFIIKDLINLEAPYVGMFDKYFFFWKSFEFLRIFTNSHH